MRYMACQELIQKFNLLYTFGQFCPHIKKKLDLEKSQKQPNRVHEAWNSAVLQKNLMPEKV